MEVFILHLSWIFYLIQSWHLTLRKYLDTLLVYFIKTHIQNFSSKIYLFVFQFSSHDFCPSNLQLKFLHSIYHSNLGAQFCPLKIYNFWQLFIWDRACLSLENMMLFLSVKKTFNLCCKKLGIFCTLIKWIYKIFLVCDTQRLKEHVAIRI